MHNGARQHKAFGSMLMQRIAVTHLIGAILQITHKMRTFLKTRPQQHREKFLKTNVGDFTKQAVLFVCILFCACVIRAALNNFVPIFFQPFGYQALSQEPLWRRRSVCANSHEEAAAALRNDQHFLPVCDTQSYLLSCPILYSRPAVAVC
jgi:hypothetical protein